MVIERIVRYLDRQMLSEDSHQQIIDTILNAPLSDDVFNKRLPSQTADQLVNLLKEQADKHWSIDPQVSLQCSDKIIRIGQVHNQIPYEALGKMARGDALKFIGHAQQAWDALTDAGCLFLEGQDEFGWARTCIGKVWLSTELGMTEQAFSDAEKAQSIFEAHNDQRMLMRLHWNRAAVHNHLGNYYQALNLYHQAYQKAEALGPEGSASRGPLYSNIGYSHLYLGNLAEAEHYFQSALSLHLEHGQERSVAVEYCNLAKSAQIRGDYHRALELLHNLERLEISGVNDLKGFAKRQMAECYLALNRYEDARRIALEVVEQFDMQGMTYRGVALALICLADAEAKLGHYEAAAEALQRAEAIYAPQGAESWIAVIQVKRGQIALLQHDAQTAYSKAEAAIASFEANGRSADQAEAALLLAQAAIMTQDMAGAETILASVLRLAVDKGISSAHYSAHVLSGYVSAACGDLHRAVDHYEAAIALVEETQGRLMMTLYQGFLQRQNEAFHALIALYLRERAVERAFDTLERMKTQVLLGWFTNREQLLWRHQGQYSQQLFKELAALKARHHWYHQSLYTQTQLEENGASLKSSAAREDLSTLEEKMRQVVEAIHVDNSRADVKRLDRHAPLQEIQQSLSGDAVAIEFYISADVVWAFTVSADQLSLQILPVSGDKLERLIQQLYKNIDRALSLASDTPILTNLTHMFRKISAEIYDVLVKPLLAAMPEAKTIIFIPHGILHYLPFNALYDSQRQAYLIENFQITIQPAASFLTRPTTNQRQGGSVLANTWNDRIPNVIPEAQAVARYIKAPVYCHLNASIADLGRDPAQILHLAAHGEYRMDRPEFSYIQLADGQLMFEDLLQRDLSYELVTLSGCDTGQAHMTSADESIGLGFGFLYAGADTLIVSLWRIHDLLTMEIMESLYQELMVRKPRGESLRYAQCQLFYKSPDLHPAFWGAFQLIGHSSCLSDFIE